MQAVMRNQHSNLGGPPALAIKGGGPYPLVNLFLWIIGAADQICYDTRLNAMGMCPVVLIVLIAHACSAQNSYSHMWRLGYMEAWQRPRKGIETWSHEIERAHGMGTRPSVAVSYVMLVGSNVIYWSRVYKALPDMIASGTRGKQNKCRMCRIQKGQAGAPGEMTKVSALLQMTAFQGCPRGEVPLHIIGSELS